MSDFLARVAASTQRGGGASSDYDLNAPLELPAGRKLRQAAVLMLLVPNADSYDLVLTKRSSALKHHPGQIAFAGGKQDDGDADAPAAALREAREEIGLPAGSATVLGTLPPHETVTGFQVTPVLAATEGGFEFVPEAGEVEEVFTVPLDHVLAPQNYRIEGRRWRGQMRRYYAVPYGPYYIWGATARMLRAWADRMI